jgi:regulator of RNase E activity RraA
LGIEPPKLAVTSVSGGDDVAGIGGLMATALRARGFSGAVICGGIRVNPGDVIVADADGAVTVPRDIAAQVLVKAQVLDQTEHSMYGYIEKFRSLEEAVQRFGRL